MNEIYPIAYTKVDWAIFNSLVQKAIGESPTRGLDREGIKLSDFQSYLAALSLDNKPLEQLRSGGANGSFQHVHFSFATVTAQDVITRFLQCLDVYYQVVDYRKNEYLAIMTADIKVWQDTIIKFCNSDSDYEVRATACRIMNYFEQFGFKELWCEYTKRTLDDKTFVLVRR